MFENESFDDYIRSILGYPNINNTMCQGNTMSNYNMSMNNQNMFTSNVNTQELEDCYPEIYRIVYPMITNRCSRIEEPITRNLVDRLTEEIHSAIEVNNEINVNINLQNEVQTLNTNRSKATPTTSSTKKEENQREDRQFGNQTLRELIRILIIRELLGRPGHRPPRPPFPGGRPPFPGRPPMRPRAYNDFDIYEQY